MATADASPCPTDVHECPRRPHEGRIGEFCTSVGRRAISKGPRLACGARGRAGARADARRAPPPGPGRARRGVARGAACGARRRGWRGGAFGGDRTPPQRRRLPGARPAPPPARAGPRVTTPTWSTGNWPTRCASGSAAVPSAATTRRPRCSRGGAWASPGVRPSPQRRPRPGRDGARDHPQAGDTGEVGRVAGVHRFTTGEGSRSDQGVQSPLDIRAKTY